MPEPDFQHILTSIAEQPAWCVYQQIAFKVYKKDPEDMRKNRQARLPDEITGKEVMRGQIWKSGKFSSLAKMLSLTD
jgi:hypothetical protein